MAILLLFALSACATSLYAQTGTALTRWDRFSDWSRAYWYDRLINEVPTMNQQNSGEDWIYTVVRDGNDYVGFGFGAQNITNQPFQRRGIDDINHVIGANIIKISSTSGATNHIYNRIYGQSSNWTLNPQSDRSVSGQGVPVEPNWGRIHKSEFYGGCVADEQVVVNGQPTTRRFYYAVGWTSITNRFLYNQGVANTPASSLESQVVALHGNPNSRLWNPAMVCNTRTVGPLWDMTRFERFANEKRLIYVVKVDAATGDTVWQRTYNTVSAQDYFNNKCDFHWGMAWDVRVMDNGNLLVACCAPSTDPNNTQDIMRYNRDDGVSPIVWRTHRVIKATLMEIKPDGDVRWIQNFDPAGPADRQSVFYAIDRRIGTNEYVLAGRRLTKRGWDQRNAPTPLYDPSWHDLSTSTAFVGRFTLAGGGTTAPTVTWREFNASVEPDVNVNRPSLAMDIEYDNDGTFFVPVFYNCDYCYDSWSGSAKTRVYRMEFNGATNSIDVLQRSPCHKATAFDLRVGVTRTGQRSNNGVRGGCATVTAMKVGTEPLWPEWWFNNYMQTDMVLTEYNSQLERTQVLTMDAGTQRGEFPNDRKSQECLYSIVWHADRKYVVGGNNSENKDDHYISMMNFAGCPQLSTSFQLDPLLIEPITKTYEHENSITTMLGVSPNYRAPTATGNRLTMRAGSLIHLTQGVRLNPESGGLAHLYIQHVSCNENLPGYKCEP